MKKINEADKIPMETIEMPMIMQVFYSLNLEEITLK
ncbi:hypothetical protein CLV90_3186 [Maribacter spongiicola]|uniref:Uncharacterized protein n=1 Tax=Maribacter spongiicola TaxID=1206753 RepID=A0A4R7JVR4_9FLAO|nr:hypothetical protein CLV90_3186 [Maribacter spongiicola]